MLSTENLATSANVIYGKYSSFYDGSYVKVFKQFLIVKPITLC